MKNNQSLHLSSTSLLTHRVKGTLLMREHTWRTSACGCPNLNTCSEEKVVVSRKLQILLSSNQLDLNEFLDRQKRPQKSTVHVETALWHRKASGILESLSLSIWEWINKKITGMISFWNADFQMFATVDFITEYSDASVIPVISWFTYSCTVSN